jgi:uncharacterized iron-regulated membrane protein
MKPQVLGRRVHYWLAIAVFLPALVIFSSGVLLQIKKQVPWVQPRETRGSGDEPTISFDRVLAIARSVPESGIQSWDDIDRIDVRPSRGMLKVTSKSRWELQIDTSSGAVLSSAYRRSDLIESIHDGSFFHAWAKLGLFLPAGIVLIVMLITGTYLFWLPIWVKGRRRRAPGAPLHPLRNRPGTSSASRPAGDPRVVP